MGWELCESVRATDAMKQCKCENNIRRSKIWSGRLCGKSFVFLCVLRMQRACGCVFHMEWFQYVNVPKVKLILIPNAYGCSIFTHTHSHCSINIWRCLVFILILTTVFLHFPMHTAWCSSCLASRDFKWSHRGESAAVWMHQHKMLMWNDVIRSVVGSIYVEANQQQSEFQMNGIHYALTPNLLTLWDYIILRIYLLYVYGENVILLAHTFELMLMHLQKWYRPLRSCVRTIKFPELAHTILQSEQMRFHQDEIIFLSFNFAAFNEYYWLNLILCNSFEAVEMCLCYNRSLTHSHIQHNE